MSKLTCACLVVGLMFAPVFGIASGQEALPLKQYDEIRESAADGIFEMVADDRVVLFVPASGHRIEGQLLDATDPDSVAALARPGELPRIEVRDTPLPGVYRLTSGPSSILYAAWSGHFIVGRVFDRDGRLLELQD